MQRNLFETNNGSGPAAGNGIYSDQGLAGAEIFNNTFAGNDNGAITLAAGSEIQNVVIHDNTSIGDASFLNLVQVPALATQNVTVRDNTITNSTEDAIFIDGGTGTIIRDNTVTGSGGNGVSVTDNVFSAGEVGTGIDLIGNTITGSVGSGIEVTTTTPLGISEVRSNTTNNNGVDGIHFGPTTSQAHISANTSQTNRNKDCVDLSTGVKNYWSADNNGTSAASSSPTGLCP